MKENPQNSPTEKKGLQILLPLFPVEGTLINSLVAVQKKAETVYYFNGSMPIFMHNEKDSDSFRYVTSQLIANGVCKQKDIVNCFGVSLVSVKRWVKRYRESKELADFTSKKKRPLNSKLTEEIITQIQIKYSQGNSLQEIAEELSVKINTIQKAIQQKRLTLIEPDFVEETRLVQTKSARVVIDDNTGMGKACSNATERIQASFGATTATTKFDEQTDLSCAGVLLSLPALLSNGLLNHSKDFKLENVYYTEEMIFICLAFLSLLRVQNINQASSIPCGELGRVMGLDRIPEVKTLRRRIVCFSAKGNVEDWSRKLSESWMAANTDLAGVLYIDGHVNLYYGHATTMPKRFVSRLRLCMSGSTDYWVNDKTGQPFFVINEVINSGMTAQIKTSILPRLEKEVPNQPSEEQLLQNPRLHRFMIVCDRECYSAEFFDYLWQKRVAICTYNKNVKTKWAEEDFIEYKNVQEDGTVEKLKLAEKEITLAFVSEKNPKEIKCREIRKLSASGHQTSIITTNWILDILSVGLYMFARWCQENFFKYMTDNFDIDGLVSYSMEKVSDTKMLVNPAYKQIERQLRSLNGKLSKQKILFTNTTLKIETEKGKKLSKAIAKKAEIYQEIEVLESQITIVKNNKKEVDRKITFASLPPEEKFNSVINVRKQFMDNIKMIDYRSETAMYNLIKHQLGPHHQDEGRKLLQQVYSSDADIIPDYSNKTLTVKLHNFNNKKEDRVVQYLCEKLNETETAYPGTDLRIIYKLVSS